jgi:small ubiquitin-related modifier
MQTQELQTEAMKDECEPLKIRLRQLNGEELVFLVKEHTPMSKVFSYFAAKNGSVPSQYRFMLDGNRIKDDDTVHTLELEDGDQIDVLQEQIGG